MDNKHVKTLVTEYYKDFRCTGPDCSDNCCTESWHITIDKKSYKRYKASRDKYISQITKSIKRNRENPSNDHYAYFEFKNGLCPFLNDDSLCNLHGKYGESYLCNTCYVYPRVHTMLDSGIQSALSLSCPVVTKIALLREEGIGFEYILTPSSDIRDYTITKYTSLSDVNGNDMGYYFFSIRSLCIEIIQNRSVPIDVRMFILSSFMSKINKYIDQAQTIPNIIIEYRNLLDQDHGLFKKLYDDMPNNHSIKVTLIRTMIDVSYNSSLDPSFSSIHANFLEGLGSINNYDGTEIMQCYRDGYNKYYKPFIEQYEYIIENYLVHAMFYHIFPISNTSPFDAYVYLCIKYAMIKMYLIGISNINKGLEVNTVINFFQKYSKVTDHNSEAIVKTFEFLKDNNLDTQAYMTILLKDD